MRNIFAKTSDAKSSAIKKTKKVDVCPTKAITFLAIVNSLDIGLVAANHKIVNLAPKLIIV